MSRRVSKTTLTRYGGWHPANPAIYESFIMEKINHGLTLIQKGAEHKPPVQKFKDAMYADPEMVNLWEQIFLQVSWEKDSEIRVRAHYLLSYHTN